MSDCNLEFHFETDPAPLITGNMSAVCGWIKFGVIILHEHDAAKSFPSQSTLSIQPAKTGRKDKNQSKPHWHKCTNQNSCQPNSIWYLVIQWGQLQRDHCLSHAALQACTKLPDCCSASGGSDSVLLTSAAARQMSFNPLSASLLYGTMMLKPSSRCFFWGGGVSITAWENAKLESACRARTRVDARVWCEHQSSSLSVSEQCSGSEKRTEEFAVVWRAWSPRADIAVYWNAVSPLQRVPFPLSAGTHAHAWYAHWAAGVALIQIPSLQKNVQAQSPTVPAVPVKAHKVIEILPCDLRLITIICPAPPQSASDWTLIPEGATSGKTLQLAVISFKALNATDNRAKHRDGCSGPVLCVLLE